MRTAASLEAAYPWIKWRTPVSIKLVDRSGPPRYACRFCIALHGLDGRDVLSLPTLPRVVEAHIEREHPR